MSFLWIAFGMIFGVNIAFGHAGAKGANDSAQSATHLPVALPG